MQKIINFAVVAHVDAGKSTLVDALLKQNGVFRDNEQVVDCVMDSGALERERGITITAKNCSIRYKDYKMNIVDTPGHADFSSEIERIIKTVDTVVLLVDSAEGPMPQTRFVLKEALKNNLRPILFINKIDKRDARVDEVINMTFDLFCELGASDEQLDFPIIYGTARDGIAKYELEDESNSVEPLLETIIKQVEPYNGSESDNLQLQISSLDYDSFIGRLGIGRVTKGIIKTGETVSLVKNDGKIETFRISKMYVYEGIKKVEATIAQYGDIVVISGCPNISIGDTICTKDVIDPLPSIEIEKPTISLNILVNTSPFAGKSGKYVTSRHLRDRLMAELERNVGLEVEELPSGDGYKVSGRGELHLSILIENMRREGFEFAVSKAEVIYHTDEQGHKLEPMEKCYIDVPDEFSGIPILNNMMATFYGFTGDNHRKDDDIDNLWDVFESAINLAENDSSDNRGAFMTAFDKVLSQYAVKWNITMAILKELSKFLEHPVSAAQSTSVAEKISFLHKPAAKLSFIVVLPTLNYNL